MNDAEYDKMRDLEDHYWWFVGRRRTALALLDQQLPTPNRPDVLDLGCGTGAVAQALDPTHTVTGLDMSEKALDYCRARGLTRLVQGDAMALPFPDASFQATLFACTRRCKTPVTYLEAALAHKAHVKRELDDDSPRLFAPGPPPPGELRAVRVVPNKPAQLERFVVPTNMRVPESSCIYSLFEGEGGVRERVACENLNAWSDSSGRRLAAGRFMSRR